MVSDLVKERLKKSIGKQVKIFLLNDYGYDGKITNCDDTYLEILKNRDGKYKIILLEEIKDVEVEG